MEKINPIVGIDIGSSSVRTIIADIGRGDTDPRVIGIGIESSVGIRRGSVVDVTEVVKCINASVEAAERMAGIAVEDALVSIGGTGIVFQYAKGVVAVAKADGEVTEEDLNRAISEAQVFQVPANNEILHVIPRSFRLDDQDGIRDPVGMKGVRLEVDALIIQSNSSQIKNLTKCVYQSGIEIADMVLSPLAASRAVLTKKQKELGVALVNIGGGTTSLAIYEEGDLLHTTILPVGAGHITNDIAIGLRTSIEVAERVKLEFGAACPDYVDKKEEIDLSLIDSGEEGVVSRHHVSEIIEARLEELFELVHAELRSAGKAGLLPAGIVLTGGGAKMPHIVELAKEKLKLPMQVGFPQGLGGILDKVDDPSFTTAAGLVLWGADQGSSKHASQSGMTKMFSKNAGETMDTFRKLMKKFLP